VSEWINLFEIAMRFFQNRQTLEPFFKNIQNVLSVLQSSGVCVCDPLIRLSCRCSCACTERARDGAARLTAAGALEEKGKLRRAPTTHQTYINPMKPDGSRIHRCSW